MPGPSKPIKAKRIIRGVSVEGITFFPSGSHSSEPLPIEQAKMNFQLTKTLRRKIALQKVKAHELAEIWQAGIEEGYRKGVHEGQKQGYEAGKEEGYEQGFKEGVEQIKAELKIALELTNTIAGQLAVKKEEIFSQIKPELIKFSLAVCEKLLRRELSQSKAFASLLEKLLEQSKSIIKDSPITVYLAPEDIQMLESEAHTVSLNHDSLKKVQFIPDVSMPRGNCRVESALGLVNFDINRLLANLEERVLGVRNGEEGHES